MQKTEINQNRHVCPVWVGYLLASPLRKLLQNPRKILAPHVRPSMHVLDVGCAMGFFSIPLAHLVEAGGRVVCVDLQQKMLDVLVKRARRAGLDGRIEARRCGPHSLEVSNLAGRIDFALAFAVVHEVPDAARFFAEVSTVLKPGGRLLVAEPKGEVGQESFAESVAAAEASGFAAADAPKIMRSHARLLEKQSKG